MPGHGERFVETYEDWFVRINKRVQRLERRLGARNLAVPEPTLITGTGYSGSIYATKSGGVVTVWSTTLTLTAGSVPVGGTTLTVAGALPDTFAPRAGSGNRFGAAYLSGGYAGTGAVLADGRIAVYNQTGAARSSVQFTITYIP